MSDTLLESSGEPTVPPEGDGESTPNYFLAEGVGGEGDAPEWFKGDKYKSVSDQAKAYTELEKRFGAFSGAPESYTLPEEIDEGETFVTSLINIGKDANMNQETFDHLLDLGEQVLSAKMEFDRESEMQKLGENAQSRIDNVTGFLKNNLGDKYDELKDVVSTAGVVELVESLITATAKPGLPTDSNNAGGSVTQGDIEKLMTEKDSDGKIIYHYSQSRQQEVQAAIAKMHRK